MTEAEYVTNPKSLERTAQEMRGLVAKVEIPEARHWVWQRSAAKC